MRAPLAKGAGGVHSKHENLDWGEEMLSVFVSAWVRLRGVATSVGRSSLTASLGATYRQIHKTTSINEYRKYGDPSFSANC